MEAFLANHQKRQGLPVNIYDNLHSLVIMIPLDKDLSITGWVASDMQNRDGILLFVWLGS